MSVWEGRTHTRKKKSVEGDIKTAEESKLKSVTKNYFPTDKDKELDAILWENLF